MKRAEPATIETNPIGLAIKKSAAIAPASMSFLLFWVPAKAEVPNGIKIKAATKTNIMDRFTILGMPSSFYDVVDKYRF